MVATTMLTALSLPYRVSRRTHGCTHTAGHDGNAARSNADRGLPCGQRGQLQRVASTALPGSEPTIPQLSYRTMVT
jgi:hypothetical protein